MTRVAVTGLGMTPFGKCNDSLKTLLLKASRKHLLMPVDQRLTPLLLVISWEDL